MIVLVHRPAPRAAVYAAMVLLAVVAAPGIALAPGPAFDAGRLVGAAVFAGFELVLLAIALRRVEVRLDAGVLTLASVRWPLPSREVQVAAAEVRDVVMQRSARSPAYRLALAMRGGAEIPLTASYFGHNARMEQDAAALRASCGVAPAPGIVVSAGPGPR